MYRIVIRSCGAIAAAIAAVYITALTLAREDGPAGIEVSYAVSYVAVAAISICIALAVGGWITRNIVAGEFARNRVLVASELRDELDAALARARTYGMVQQMGHQGDTGNGSVSPMRRRDREEI